MPARRIAWFGAVVVSGVALVACRAVWGFDDLTLRHPAEADDAATSDSSDGRVETIPCRPDDAFTTFGPVITTPNDEPTAFLTPDERTIYVSRTDTDGWHIYVATRPTRADPFGTAKPLDGINGKWSDLVGCLSHDGTELLFATTRANGANWQIWFASRTGPGEADFAANAELPNVNGVSTKDPFLGADGGVLYFTRSDDGVAQEIYRAQATAMNSFAAPERVRGLPGIQTNPVESADGDVLYFAAATDVDASLSGMNDIWVARASDGGFTTPTRVDELNSPEDDTPAWLSPDLCRLYFSSSRDHAGNRDIWMAAREPR